MKEYNRPAHDPKKLLVNCITTDGGDNFHYTGSRKNTVREVGVYQTFPISFIWKGSHTTAMECAGNAVPPRAYEPIALNCAATLEAYRHGFIDADEEIDDLFETLTARGVIIPGTNSAPINLVDGDSQARAPTNPYRYINRLQPWKGRGKYTNHSLWSRKIDLNRPEPEKKRERRVHPNFGLFGGVSDEPAPTPRIERRLQSVHTEIEGLTSAKANGELMELD
jgi:DNA (cytosine-5)-methyltransferase 1